MAEILIQLTMDSYNMLDSQNKIKQVSPPLLVRSGNKDLSDRMWESEIHDKLTLLEELLGVKPNAYMIGSKPEHKINYYIVPVVFYSVSEE